MYVHEFLHESVWACVCVERIILKIAEIFSANTGSV